MMDPRTTHMFQEAGQVGEMIARQIADLPLTEQLVVRTQQSHNGHFLTIARGSSDHAANYFSYLVTSRLGIVTSSLSPSLITVHRAPLNVSDATVFGFSQSGASPDLIESVQYLAQRGAQTIACVNQPDSPLSHVAHHQWPIHAETEQSVAATKSCIGIMSLAAQWVGLWQKDRQLLSDIHHLSRWMAAPDFERTTDELAPYLPIDQAYVIGRGLSYSIALEAALKLKETCAIQAEAFSAAEVRHGPMRLIERNYPVFVFITNGVEQAQLIEFSVEMARRGARILAWCLSDLTLQHTLHQAGIQTQVVPIAAADLDPVLTPLVLLQNFYQWVSHLAVARGLNPDQPLFLNKVTQTH